jgi:hypothetical protein
MTTLQEIENKIDSYLFLPDKSVIKLLAAFALTCKLPIPPLWLFIAGGSSTGKTELLSLLEKVKGWYALDDLTENTLLSGMKRHDQSASLLDRLPKQGFIVFKDFTTMLSKNKDVLGAIMGKLRVIYDGSYKRETGGQVESKMWEGKLSLLAAGTGTIYSKTEEFNEMGTRSVVYKLDAPDDYDIGSFMYDHQKDDRKQKKEELQSMVELYIKNIQVPATYDQLPPITREVWKDLEDIAHLASTARSPVEREKWGPNRRQTMKHEKEGMGRLFGQLKAAAYGLMLQNERNGLTNADKKLLYKIGLDCIDPRRRGVLQALTRNVYGGDTQQIGDYMGYVKESADIFVEDLYAHDMLEKHRAGNKTSYTIKDKYRDIMSKFENIKVEQKALPTEETPAPEEQKAIAWEEVKDYLPS